MKLENEIAIIKNPAIKKIGLHLLQKTEKDVLLKKTLEKENKSLSECYQYIVSQAKKKAKNGCACIEDETVYKWALHYYDEDSIVIEKGEPAASLKSKSEKVRTIKEKTCEGQLDLFSFEG